MQKLFTLIFFIPFSLNAQIYWSEEFGTGTGCNQAQLATSYSGVNGNWTLTSTGNNGSKSNIWYVSAESSNAGAGTCETGCSSSFNWTLHIANDPNSPGAFIFCPTGDCGAAYDDSDSTTITSKRIESPTINLAGLNGLQMSFIYIMKGQSGFDYGRIWYYDGAIWVSDSIPLITPNCASLQSKWVYSVVNLPSFANNNPNFKVGFEWKNNGDGIANDPSFSIDDIRIANSFVSIDEVTDTFPFSYYINDNIVSFDIMEENNIRIELFDLTGKLLQTELNRSAIKLPGKGLHLIRVWIDHQPFILKVIGN